MISSLFSLLTLSTLSGATAIDLRQEIPYHYIPVQYDYGFDSRVTSNLTIGTAPDAKSIKVVMDSGSANFWLWAPGSIIRWGSKFLGQIGPCNLTVPTLYDPSKSPTAIITNHTSSYSYAGNAKIVQGDQYTNDTLTALGGSGPIPGVEIAMQNLGLIRIGDDGKCLSVDYDKSILGLSPFTNKTAGPSFRQNLYEAGQIASKTMVMWFDKHVIPFGQLKGGILFGAIDTSKFTGKLVRVPNVTGRDQIGTYVPKPNVTINGQVIRPDKEQNCLIDSGAHGDSLPFDFEGTEEARFFNASALVNLIDYRGVVAYNGTCDKIPADLKITYTFPGVEVGEEISIDVLVRNYARGYAPPGAEHICLLNLETRGCIFGAPFLSGAVMALDDEDNAIGLAQGGVSEEGKGIDAGSLKRIGRGESWDTVG